MVNFWWRKIVQYFKKNLSSKISLKIKIAKNKSLEVNEAIESISLKDNKNTIGNNVNSVPFIPDLHNQSLFCMCMSQAIFLQMHELMCKQ